MSSLPTLNLHNFQPPNYPIFVRDREGLIYDYRLGIRPILKQNSQLEFTIESVTIAANPSHKPKRFYAPIQLLPLIRDRMAKLLVEFDRSQQIGPPPSQSQFPKWVFEEEGICSSSDLFSNHFFSFFRKKSNR